MSQDYVKVYDASNAAEAELIREAMHDAEIRAYIDTTPSPLDGLLAMGQGIPVLVEGDKVEQANAVIEAFGRRHVEEADESDGD